MIDFTLTDEQELLLESLGEWLEQCQYGDDYFKECWENAVYPIEFEKEFMSSDFGKLGLPEDLCGMPVDSLTMALLDMTMAKHNRPSVTTQLMNVDSIAHFGTKAHFERAIAGMQQELMPSALACSEPGAGSDNSSISTSYVRKDGKIILNGTKTMCTNADHCAQLQVIARDFSVESPYKGMTAFMVDPNAPGVKIQPMHKIGARMFTMCEVFFEDVELTEADIFGQEHKGFYQLMHNFETERLCICSVQVGVSMLAYNDAYAQERVQFGQKIGDFQLVLRQVSK